MIAVVSCISNQHSLPLVFVAALICLLGSAITLRLLHRGTLAAGRQKLGWRFLAAVAGGGGVWTTLLWPTGCWEQQIVVWCRTTFTQRTPRHSRNIRYAQFPELI